MVRVKAGQLGRGRRGLEGDRKLSELLQERLLASHHPSQRRYIDPVVQSLNHGNKWLGAYS